MFINPELEHLNPLVARAIMRRKELGMTQQELANASGLSRRTIIAFEAGEANISLMNFEEICQTLNLVVNLEPAKRPTLDDLYAEREYRFKHRTQSMK